MNTKDFEEFLQQRIFAGLKSLGIDDPHHPMVAKMRRDATLRQLAMDAYRQGHDESVGEFIQGLVAMVQSPSSSIRGLIRGLSDNLVDTLLAGGGQ